jgi:mannose-6-phosphate isomerase
MGPLIFEPIMVEKIWGGTWLRNENILSNDFIGEAIIFGDNNELLNKEFDWDKELKMKYFNDVRTPLMIKFLDAQQDLSVQVHPKKGAYCKTEAWYVLDADENGEIIYGLKGNLSDFEKALLTAGDIEPFLNRVKVQKGDLIYLPSGIVHALGRGIKVLEIQQNSNITYRLYDYGRDREIHVEEGLKNIDEYINFNPPAIRNSVKSSEFKLGENIIKMQITNNISGNYECSYTLLVSLDKEVKMLNNGSIYTIPPFSAALLKNDIKHTVINKCQVVLFRITDITLNTVLYEGIENRRLQGAK